MNWLQFLAVYKVDLAHETLSVRNILFALMTAKNHVCSDLFT